MVTSCKVASVADWSLDDSYNAVFRELVEKNTSLQTLEMMDDTWARPWCALVTALADMDRPALLASQDVDVWMDALSRSNSLGAIYTVFRQRGVDILLSAGS